MAAKKHLELFFERFLSFNLNRYKDDATSLAYFTGLVYDDVAITNVVPLQQQNRFSASVASATRRFRGINQSWTAANAATDLNLWELKNTGAPLADAAELAAQTVAGVYEYLDAEGVPTAGVVIPEGIETADIAAAVTTVLNAAARYENEGYTVAEGGDTAVVKGTTYNGTLTWAEALIPMLEIPDTDYGQLVGAPVVESPPP